MEAQPPPANPPRLRFSLWTLLAVMTAVAILAAALSGLAAPLDSIVYTSIALGFWPTAALTAVVYGRGAKQAFAIGALVPIVLLVVAGGGTRLLYAPSPFLAFVWILGLSAACGGVAVWTRRAVIEAPSE